MKVNFIETTYIDFHQIKIGEVFEIEGIICLKVDDKYAFDIFNNKLEYCKGWDNLIPRESEITIY